MGFTSGSNHLLVWKPTACLWCLIRREARSTQLFFSPSKTIQTCLNSYFSREKLVGKLNSVAMGTHKEKKQSKADLHGSKRTNLLSIGGIWSHSGVLLCKIPVPLIPGITHFPVQRSVPLRNFSAFPLAGFVP